MDRHGRIGPGHHPGPQNVARGRVHPHHNAFLRRMVENDNLVDRKEGAVRLAVSISTGKRLHGG